MTLYHTRYQGRYEFKSNKMKINPYRGQLHQEKTQKQSSKCMAAINKQNEKPNPTKT